MDNTILLVDDDEAIVSGLSRLLTRLGMRVLTAGDGRRGLAVFRQERPPIVITDIRMPVMDGIELLRHIKGEKADTEVIMITGHGNMEEAVKSLKYEASDFITKPIGEDALEFAVRKAREKVLMRQELKAYTENLEALVEEKSARLIEAERVATLNQVVEGLSTFIRNFAGDIEEELKYFNDLPCLVAIHDRNLKVVASNPLYRKRIGDRVGRPSWEMYQGKAGTRDHCPAARTLHSGRGYRSREIMENVAGEEIPVMVHAAPIRNQGGEVGLVLEISADITEANRLRDELKETRRRYQLLFDEVPCYISVQDQNLRLTAVNRRFKEDFGNETGAYCYRAYKHRSEACQNCPVMKTFQDGRVHEAEMVVTSRYGEQYNVLMWTAPIRSATGAVEQVMTMSTNITQIRKLQDHLSSLGLMMGSISHGIKGILTGLDAGVYLLNTGFAKNSQEQVEEGLEVVKLMVERIRNVVLDILYYAKKRDLKWERVDAVSFASDVAAVVEPKARQHGIDFRKRFDEEAGMFEVDAGIVRSALINILENAIDACLEDAVKGGHWIEFSLAGSEGKIVFQVRDNGVGMDEKTRRNMFTIFFSSKGNRGTGLGLFIANKIVQQHGGAIRVESEAGSGSHFTITMPRELPETVKQPPEESPEPLSGPA